MPRTRMRAPERVSGWLERIREFVQPAHLESMQALLAAVDAKDSYTREHSIRVAGYAEAIARRVQLPKDKLRTLQAAALLHDVGKIGIPDRILAKPGPLNDEEQGVIKQHPRIALDILMPMCFLTDHRPIILYHHERYDGRGYPGRLIGATIPIESRILSVADALDTMLSPRPYKNVNSLDEIRRELSEGSGKQFDPHLAGVALAWLDEPGCDAARRAGSAGTPVSANRSIISFRSESLELPIEAQSA